MVAVTSQAAATEDEQLTLLPLMVEPFTWLLLK